MVDTSFLQLGFVKRAEKGTTFLWTYVLVLLLNQNWKRYGKSTDKYG